ncbi:MAG: hypothetical protein AAF715_19500 [Myxococcota bacterium]
MNTQTTNTMGSLRRRLDEFRRRELRMRNHAALLLSTHQQHEPATDVEARCLEALRRIYDEGDDR